MVQAAWQGYFPLDWLREINAQVSTLMWIKLRTVTTHTRLPPSLLLASFPPPPSPPTALVVHCVYILLVHATEPFLSLVQIAIDVTRSGLSLQRPRCS